MKIIFIIIFYLIFSPLSWLITVDQYYQEEVAYILDTVMDMLQENPDRKFMYVEVAFFERWWIQLTLEKQVRKNIINELI